MSLDQVWLLTDNDNKDGCLALRLEPDTGNSLYKTSSSCTATSATICRLDVSDAILPYRPSKFPCLKPDNESRNKRDARNLGKHLDKSKKHRSGNIFLQLLRIFRTFR